MTTIEIAKELECFETPSWCIEEVLKQRIVEKNVWDSCCGPGAMSKTAKEYGHEVYSTDIYDWGYGHLRSLDFLLSKKKDIPFNLSETSLFINPPFSKAVEFVEHGLFLGVKNVIAFQRFSWLESKKRRAFWDTHCPKEIYLCGSRATCWLTAVPEDDRGGSTTTAHAWFVFDHKPREGSIIRRIYKNPRPKT